MIPKFLKAAVLLAAIATLTACGEPKTRSGNPVQGNATTVEGEAEAKSTLDRIREEGKLIVGISEDYPPFSFVEGEGEGEDSKYVGLEIDIARYLALELIGEEALIEFVPLNTEDRLEKLESGEVDILIATLSQTEERKQQIAFSEAYYSSGVGLLVPKSSDFKAWGDMKEKTVCTLGTSVYSEELEKLGMEILEAEDSNAILAALKAKKCDGGAMEEAAITGLLRDPKWGSEYKNSGLPVLFPTPWGMGMRRGPENESLLEAVNLAILQMEAEEFIVKKEEEWNIPITDYTQERMELAKLAVAAQPKKEEQEEEESFLSGYLAIADGSSSILPMTLALSETFEEVNKGVRVGVGGTGINQGFAQLCNGEIDIVHAARPINKEEMKLCRKKRVRYVEMPFAFDGIAVVTNPKNTWATCLKRSELKQIWEAEATGTIDNWQKIREDFDDSPLVLSAPPADSGTSEYFLEAILGQDIEGRADYDAQEDEALIVQSVTAEEGALGILGISTYEANKEVLKVIQIENEAGKCVAPSRKTIDNGTYSPLARPLFFYVSKEALTENPAVKELAKFFVDPENQAAIARFGYVPVSGELLEKVRTRLSNGVSGTLFAGSSAVGVNLSNKLLGARTTEVPEDEQKEG